MTLRDNVSRKSGSSFSLEKYYADLVTAEGQYFIGYFARLNWGAVKISYSDSLYHSSLTGIKSGPSLSSRDSPIEDDSVFTWRCPKLGFEGQWQRVASAEGQILLQNDEGVVDWRCAQPSARVQLTTSSGAVYRGLGYVEFLKLTIPPWQLGLRSLLWGRFVSEDYSVVWIEWQGKHNLVLLSCNGQRATNPQISDDSVRCESFELSLQPAETIRKNSIGETLISIIPSGLKAAPIEFFGGKEQKYVSLGRLAFIDGSIHNGWVIHERVSWGQDSI